MNPIGAIAAQGQSIWYDYIERGLIWTGGLYRMIKEDGLKGVTSNPSIFEKAIKGSKDYAPALRHLVQNGASAGEAFEMLALEDVTNACDVMRQVYDETQGKDGFVSLEVSPHLAYDTALTVQEGMDLWENVGRDNLMIKVPATSEGVTAIEALIACGINVNVTLLFDVDRYVEVFNAYMAGLEQLQRSGGDLSQVSSVASFFISRIDSAVDAQLDSLGDKGQGLKGKIAIANAKKAYAAYEEIIASDRWKALEKDGARAQRLLWASTSAKNPAYKDTLYVEQLIGPETVNTVPSATYDAFKDHGEVASTLKQGLDEAQAALKELDSLGVNLGEITSKLLEDGVELFADAFDRLMGTIEGRRQEILGAALNPMTASLGNYQEKVDARLAEMDQNGFSQALWARDGSLFSEDPEAIEHAESYMGWLDIAEDMESILGHLEELQDELEDQDVEQVVVMGMGGSSLAPDVFAKTFGQLDGSPELLVLDSTVPSQVRAMEKEVGDATVFIVASKSGTTSEPLAFDAYFYDKYQSGDHFIAITDPDSKLEAMAEERGFRSIFPGEPEVGGRFSALSPFGMVPAACMGLDVAQLLECANLMVSSCGPEVPASVSPGARLGVAMGELALAGRDKLTLFSSPSLSAFGAWLEQLIAESTGKHGKGIVPVDGEQLGEVDSYGNDRVFAYLKLTGDDEGELPARLEALEKAGHPVIRIELETRAALVQEMFRWEIATATAGHVMQLNPFDQPNVQESKSFTADFLKTFEESGALPDVPGEEKLLEENGIAVFTDGANAKDLSGKGSLKELISAHLARAGEGDYVAFNAYVEMNEENGEILQAMREHVRTSKKLATTVGYGPRFLHSTGQLHKGGANNGVFLQITAEDAEDLAVPGSKYGFSTLKTAQERGDFMALSKRERRVVRIHLPKDVKGGLEALFEALK